MNNHRLTVARFAAMAIALLAGLGELVSLQAWRLRDRLARSGLQRS